jgi:hypothetical protein
MNLFTQIRDLSHEAEKMKPFDPHMLHADTQTNPMDKIMMFWPFIKVALRITKIFVGDAADKIIDGILVYGDLVQSEKKEFNS